LFFNRRFKKYDDNDFTDKQFLSSGAYGDIYSAYSKKDGIRLALKIINMEKMKQSYKENEYKEGSYKNDLNNEIRILNLLSNYENSVKYFGNYDKNNEKIIVLELCDENLKAYMKNRNNSFDVEKIKEIFKGLNEVFKKMQGESIIHRDLKLENFLVKKTENKIIVKLSDYGIGKFINKGNSSISGLKGTSETCAPEIRLQEKTNFSKYNSLVDIFSLGVILYQLSHNLKHPFKIGEIKDSEIANYMQYYDNDDYIIEFDDSIKNEDFKDLLKKMLKLNPNNRLTWKEYFNHPFFK
jgi:serine/threonine protein kinase